MNSGPTPDDVLEALGDKVVVAIVRAVADARVDLGQYRAAFPGWVSDHSATGLANWINDRVWAHLLTQVDPLRHVAVESKGHTRELTVGTTHRLRVKRHDPEGRITSYPTQEALEFYESVPSEPTLPGLGELCLTAGYIWDRDSRMLGAAVVALSQSLGAKALWVEPLPGQDDVPVPLRRPARGPMPPIVETDLGRPDEGEGERAT